jgi:hypothetical protein
MPGQPRQTGKKPPQRRFSVAAVTQPTAGGGEHTAPSPAAVAAEQDHPVPAAEIVEEATEGAPTTPEAPATAETPQESTQGTAPEADEKQAPPASTVPAAGTATDVVIHRTSPAEQSLGALARRKRGDISAAMHAAFTRSLQTELMSLRSLADRLTEKQANFENLVAEARAMGYSLADVNRLCVTHDWFEIVDGTEQT